MFHLVLHATIKQLLLVDIFAFLVLAILSATRAIPITTSCVFALLALASAVLYYKDGLRDEVLARVCEEEKEEEEPTKEE